MSKPVARVGDMTSDAGMIVEPGNARVFINGAPVACTGGNHLTSMVVGTLPLVGGPAVGPANPKVYSGGKPISCVGDMVLTAGSPASVITGSPNVFIGMNSGGAGGSTPLKAVAEAMKKGLLKVVEGTEGSDPEVQALTYMTQQSLISRGGTVTEDTIRSINQYVFRKKQSELEIASLTIADFVRMLKKVEWDQGIDSAIFFARQLNHDILNFKARAFVEGDDLNPDNDPNIMPTRFMLLWGADDDKLQELDEHPDCPGHKICVGNLRRGLRATGVDVLQTGYYDEKLDYALLLYTSEVFIAGKHEKRHTVRQGEGLGVIAQLYNLPSWKFLYRCNKKGIGSNPDILQHGMELEIPQWDCTTGDELIRSRCVDPAYFTGGRTFVYPWVVVSGTLVDSEGLVLRDKNDDGETLDSFRKKKTYEIRNGETDEILASGEIGRSEDICTVVPDVPVKKLVVDGSDYVIWNGGMREHHGIAARFSLARPRPDFEVDFCIDGHSHIQSGACAPLPLVWDKNPVLDFLQIRRTVINGMASAAQAFRLMDGVDTQKKSTSEIADELVSHLVVTYGKDSKLRRAKEYRRCSEVFSPVIIMPMDMDFAHIAGFPPSSSTVYHEGLIEKPEIREGGHIMRHRSVHFGVYYYERENGLHSEEKGRVHDVTFERPEKGWLFQEYKKQHQATVDSVKKYPWKLIPMFHYEPRRWCRESGFDVEEKHWLQGAWDYPFKFIATAKREGMFIGFKMYPPLGYKPFDSRLPLLDKFYARCKDEKIPILTHCSPGGMFTHEWKFYHELDGVKLNIPQVPLPLGYKPWDPKGYFYHEYVHPKNWRPVLMKYPDLKLCLAHLGGDEWKNVGITSHWISEIVDMCNPNKVQGYDEDGNPIRFKNVYTDVSCYDLKDEEMLESVSEMFRRMKYDERYYHMRDRNIFGMDWYLTLITKGPQYKEYVESFFDCMGRIDEWQWYRSALVNPAKFYGLDDLDMLEKMNSALEDEVTNNEMRKSGYMKMLNIKTQIEIIQRELSKIQ